MPHHGANISISEILLNKITRVRNKECYAWRCSLHYFIIRKKARLLTVSAVLRHGIESHEWCYKERKRKKEGEEENESEDFSHMPETEPYA